MARKGQFKKGGGRHGDTRSHSSSKSRRSSTHTIVRAPAPHITVQAPRAPAKQKRPHGRRRGGGGGDSLTPMALGKKMLISAALGYTVGDNAPNKIELVEKIPTVGKLPKEAIIGGVAYLFRKKHRLVRDIAETSLIVAGNKVGASGFKLSGYYDD